MSLNYLADCYLNSLKIALENNVHTLAFPNISTGVYGYPKESAGEIAVKTVAEFLEKNDEIEEVIFVCFDEDNYRIYENYYNFKINSSLQTTKPAIFTSLPLNKS